MKTNIKISALDEKELIHCLKVACSINEPFDYLIVNEDTYKKLSHKIIPAKSLYEFSYYDYFEGVECTKFIKIAICNNLDFGEVELL